MKWFRLFAAVLALSFTAACADGLPTGPSNNDDEPGYIGSGT
ncbi:MAG: hypothetical protein WEA09_14565 [Gemmatimonadota bacterium]